MAVQVRSQAGTVLQIVLCNNWAVKEQQLEGKVELGEGQGVIVCFHSQTGSRQHLKGGGRSREDLGVGVGLG